MSKNWKMHGGFIISDSGPVCMLPAIAGEGTDYSNAHLILAAPDLVEALELVMGNSTNFRLHAPKGMIDKIECVIEKAKGEV